MSDIRQLQNEANRHLREINNMLCCMRGYDEISVQAVTTGNSKTFATKSAHSISWDLGSGASITIAIDGGSAVSFTKEGAIEFSSLNTQSIVITAVGGNISLIWTY